MEQVGIPTERGDATPKNVVQRAVLVSPGAAGRGFDILPRLKTRESHGTAPLSWDIVVYDVACS
jgi:hypothetical protein